MVLTDSKKKDYKIHLSVKTTEVKQGSKMGLEPTTTRTTTWRSTY